MMKKFFKNSIVLFMFFLTIGSLNTALGSPDTFPIQGQLIAPNGKPVESSSVDFTIQVLSTADECLLFEETFNIDMTESQGIFSLNIGRGANTGTGHFSSVVQSLNNSLTDQTGLTCASGSNYQPQVGDTRKLRLSFDDGTGTNIHGVDHIIGSVPYAMYAGTLQGRGAFDFIQVNTTTANLGQPELEFIFDSTSTGSNYDELLKLINGTSDLYSSLAASGAATLPTFDSTTPPSSPAAGDIWYNSDTSTVEFFDGTSIQNVSSGDESGTVTNITAGSGLDGGSITSSGTISIATGGIDDSHLAGSGFDITKFTVGSLDTALLDIGTGPSQLIQLDESSRLPAVDGSQLINLPAGNPGTITNITAGSGLDGGSITSSGTISIATGGIDDSHLAGSGFDITKFTVGSLDTALLDTGTGPNQLVQLDGFSRLPPVDGSLLTNLPEGVTQLGGLSDTNVNYSNNNLFLGDNSGSSATGGGHTGIGKSALASLTTGINNTAVGVEASFYLTGGSLNTVVGNQAFWQSGSGGATNFANTAVGNQALYSSHTFAHGNHNTALGAHAGYTDGANILEDSTLLGYNAGRNASGAHSTLVGYEAGLNSNSDNLIAVGSFAFLNGGGFSSAGIGIFAGFNHGGQFNAFMGLSAGSAASGSTGDYNVAIGRDAYGGTNVLRSGSNNIALGNSSSPLMSSGSGNIGIGRFSQSSTTTGNFNIGIGDNAGAAITTGSRNISIGNNVFGDNNTGNDQLNIGNAIKGNLANGHIGIGGNENGTHVFHVSGTAGLSSGSSWTSTSDRRLKDIHGPYEFGLNEILQLDTVRFNYKPNNPLNLPSDKEIVGFIAQDVQKVIPEAVLIRDDGFLELNVDPIHWAQVNAIKELHEICQQSKSETQKVKEQIDFFKAQIISKVDPSTAKRNLALSKSDNSTLQQENKALRKRILQLENDNKRFNKELDEIKKFLSL